MVSWWIISRFIAFRNLYFPMVMIWEFGMVIHTLAVSCLCHNHDDVIKMETFSALLTLCVANSQVTCEIPSQRPVTRSFDVFFGLHLNKRLSKQSWGWWFETPSRSRWRHLNDIKYKWRAKGTFSGFRCFISQQSIVREMRWLKSIVPKWNLTPEINGSKTHV